MNLVVLGRGKTGSLVAQLAQERGHRVAALGSTENANATALTPEKLKAVDAVIDFTTPQAVIPNIEACTRAGVSMVVGTTGWHAELDRVRKLVEKSGTGLVYGTNFSLGVNVFFEVARAAATAVGHGYFARIMEKHHTQKKDSPSGTALTLKRLLQKPGEPEIEITSIREGDTVGQHIILLDSGNDTMMLVHDAKSRQGFAEGALLAAEWIRARRGVFEFADVLKHE
ncbi:MAG: 4-hydroxy-tetrahydrodipicolinate reductase [Acidobacteriales bacterium]|nr:4-hydroxy-tetrahydrodipicolinate reductase [Terriglobales bacterium]